MIFRRNISIKPALGAQRVCVSPCEHNESEFKMLSRHRVKQLIKTFPFRWEKCATSIQKYLDFHLTLLTSTFKFHFQLASFGFLYDFYTCARIPIWREKCYLFFFQLSNEVDIRRQQVNSFRERNYPLAHCMAIK